MLIPDGNYLPLLIMVDQALDRCREVFVGYDNAKKLANIEYAANCQVAAHQIEKERQELNKEIVDELYHELALVEFEPNEKQIPQDICDVGALVIGSVVCMGFLDTFGDFPQFAGKLTCHDLAFAIEFHKPAPQYRYQPSLKYYNNQGNQAEPDILQHDEKQCHQRLATEEERLCECITNEFTHWFNFVLDHAGNFRGPCALESCKWITQYTVEQFKPQTPEDTFTHPALECIDIHLELAVCDDKKQECQAQGNEVSNSFQFQPFEQYNWRTGQGFAKW